MGLVLRQASFDKLPSTSFLRQASFDKLPSTSFLRQASFDKLPSTSFLRQASFDKLPSTSFLRQASFDKLPSTSFLRQASFDKLRTNERFIDLHTPLSPSRGKGLGDSSFDRLPSTSFLRQASFDKLPSTSSGRTNGLLTYICQGSSSEGGEAPQSSSARIWRPRRACSLIRWLSSSVNLGNSIP